MPQTHFAVIALGSNLAEPARQVRAALSALEAHPQIQIEKTSSLYLTAPVGYDNQPDFVNAVCSVRTSLDGVSLLAVLNRIEADFGRNARSETPRAHWTWTSSILTAFPAATRI